MIYKSKKTKKILLKRIKIKIYKSLFLFFIFFIIPTFFIFNLKIFSINNINIIGNDIIKTEDINKIVNKETKNKRFFLYKKNSIFFFPKEKIKTEILKNKKVLNVEIKQINYFKDVEIKIEERKTKYLYCLFDSDKCYSVDNNGFIFSEFNINDNKDFIVLYSKNKVNNIFLNKEEFKKLKNLIDKIQKKNLKIISVYEKENEFYVILKNKTKIIILKKQDFGKVIETISKLIVNNNFKVDKNRQCFIKNIEYINLSYIPKIFYCLKGNICEKNYSIK